MDYQELAHECSEIKIAKLHQEALELYHNKQLNYAESKFEEVLELDIFNAAAWLNIGTLYYTTERYSEALEAFNNSLYIDSSTAIIHYSIGLVLEKLGSIPQAIQAYQQAIFLDSQWIDAYNQLGKILCIMGNFNAAESVYIKAISTNPKHFNSYLNLGNVLLEQERIDEAIVAYEQALQLKPRDSYILYNLGVAFEAKNDDAEAALNYGYSYYRQGKYEEAIEQYEKYLASTAGDIFLYAALAECYRHINKTENAITAYEEGVKLYPQSDLLCFHLIGLLQYCGKVQEAIEFTQKVYQSRPNALAFKLEEQRILPIIYEKEEDIELYRQKFINSLESLTQNTRLDTLEAKKSALEGINYRTNFYLQYQAKNDRELQKKYGQFVHQVMAANYPEWVKSFSKRSLKQHEKIRVGYVSNYLRAHTVGKLMLGWLRNKNSQDFETYCYYTDKNIDFRTQQFRLHSNYFHHIPENFEGVCNQIITDKLDILVFLDIGMHPQMTAMAGLRLAPIQCTTWGHPITSGIPTIDYFLSCKLMEPENAQQHYSEKLIYLPNIGVSYRKPVIPKPEKSRLEFGLRDEAVVYLSCQSLFKYLPQFDYIFPAIAQKVPEAQFVFISHQSSHITNLFRKRLDDAFAKLGLNSEDYCVISPRIGWNDYCNLNQISDVFLDTFSWSGGNTTLEAIACDLPIVTCPGEFMRGRHSYGILQMLGVTDTIAKTEAEYIEIAVKLGQNSEWINHIVERMRKRHSYLYDDKTCVQALEDFYRCVVS